MPKFNHVVIVSDNIRGHYHQSLGIARWIERLQPNVEVDEDILKLEKLSTIEKIKLKFSAKKLSSKDKNYALEWLKNLGISIKRYKPETLFISAGSSAAPFCLALARATDNKCAVVMTPSILGTKPFDYAIVPEHDKHNLKDKNLITTLGAPNHIYNPEIKTASENFFGKKDFQHKVVALLLGGSDANYNPNAQWAADVLGPLRYFEGITVLITTSRRTSQALENEVRKMFENNPSTGYFLVLSENPKVNAVTAMLGAATHVLVTEDSVSMVSEAATAGFKVGLMRVPRTEGDSLKRKFGKGTKRFDEMFEKMKEKGLIEDLGEVPDFYKFLEPHQQKHNKDFNEAKRTAEWILSS